MTPVEWLASYLKQRQGGPSTEEIEARAQGLYGNLRPEQKAEIASMIDDDVQPTKVCAIILTMILNELVGIRAELSKGVDRSDASTQREVIRELVDIRKDLHTLVTRGNPGL